MFYQSTYLKMFATIQASKNVSVVVLDTKSKKQKQTNKKHLKHCGFDPQHNIKIDEMPSNNRHAII